jgi:hypothetical protein
MMRLRWRAALLLGATIAGGGCNRTTEAPPPAAITAADVDLPATVEVVRSARVRDAADLQRRLNRDSGPRVDIDHDGRRDALRVLERRNGNRRTLEIRALPSTRRGAPIDSAVPVAYLDFAPDGERVDVVARYAEIVVQAPPPITFVVTPIPGTFVYWLVFAEHPIYVAPVIEVEHVHMKHYKHYKWR